MEINNIKTWFTKQNWKDSPFTLRISPQNFVGYKEQTDAALRQLSEKHKITLLLGPTGSGKTSMLKWLEEENKNLKTLYLTKPPKQAEEFIDIFLDSFPMNFFERIFRKKPSLFNINDYLNKKLKGKHLLFLLDESHETNRDVLEWLRVIIDQIDNVSLFLAGLPKLEHKIKANLETLDQRITTRIRLNNLTEEETRDLIEKRIKNVGENALNPFTDEALRLIYDKTGGFPREIIKMCDKLVNEAIEKNLDVIDVRDIEEYKEFGEKPEETVVSAMPQPLVSVKDLPYKQRKILERLSEKDWLTPTEIAEHLGTSSYKTKEHAVRSINNILKRLMIEGYVQREGRGKAFVYSLTPKVRAYFVEA